MGHILLSSAAGSLDLPVPGCSLQPKMMDLEFRYTQTLAQEYLLHTLQAPQNGISASRTSRVLQDVAFSVQEEVEESLKPWLDRCDVASIDAARTIFTQVMEKEFEDGIINWGRIVTIFAFGGVLLKKLPRELIAPDVDTYQEMSSLVAEFIMNHTGDWIRQHGGWENGFVRKFEPKSSWLTLVGVTGQICEMLSLLKQFY